MTNAEKEAWKLKVKNESKKGIKKGEVFIFMVAGKYNYKDYFGNTKIKKQTFWLPSDLTDTEIEAKIDEIALAFEVQNQVAERARIAETIIILSDEYEV